MVKILNVREVETEKKWKKNNPAKDTEAATRNRLANEKMGGGKFCLFNIRYRFVC